MNKTKRKIFETSMSLFAKKGYDATSIEEITSVVGVAKGTLYYHFSSKEEIFNFLVEEGMNLLKKSIKIKTSPETTAKGKLKAIILIQIKIIVKYEDFITIVLSQMLGKDSKSLTIQNFLFDYLKIIEDIIQEGIDNNEISKTVNPSILAYCIFGFTCTSLLNKIKTNLPLDINKLYDEYVNILIGNVFL